MVFSKGGFGPLFVLVPYAPCPVVKRLAAGVTRTEAGTLAVRYELEADLARLRLSPGKGELWQHTCFELFIAPHGKQGYHEFNFSVSGAWAAYAFSSYRKGTRLEDPGLDPRIAVRKNEQGLELEAAIDLERLGAQNGLSLGLSAVIEDASGGLSYWALRHAPGKPDFHNPDCFSLRVDALRD